MLNLGARWSWVVSATTRPHYHQEADPVHIVQESGWDPWAGLNVCGKYLRPSGVRTPNRPVRSVVAIPTTLSRPTPHCASLRNVKQTADLCSHIAFF
jgi:hypothetical protein